MTARDLLLDRSAYDLSRVVAGIDEIRRYIPQRDMMEQLTAIVHIDEERKLIVGYKDVGHDEFWVAGHFPGAAVMPGVVMCEAAAQLASYFCSRFKLMGGKILGLAGLDEVRIRGPVQPGDRMVIVAAAERIRPNVLLVCRFQCFVDEQLVAEGVIRGAALPDEIEDRFRAAMGAD
ncbi:MAG: beta-hydroxyacyl-ACP dehydratase [Pirellulales bacterium]|nr:beta-hydroxyacyl-ACP dehydratase [Pirellulales bacterium]